MGCCIFAVLIGADAAVSLRLTQPGLRAPRLASPLRMMSGDDFYFGESDVKVSASTTEAVEEEERELTEKEKEIARLRAAEVFMRKENGDASCTVCGYKYKMVTGAGMTAPPSTPFDLLGDSWTCPQCKSPKAFFTPDTVEIAGSSSSSCCSCLGTLLT